MQLPSQAPVPGATAIARLVVGLLVLTFLLVVVGVIVRTTGSGLGCGSAGGWHDWPLCDGGMVPPPVIHSIIEYSHRLCAFLVTVGVVVVVARIWRSPALRERLGTAAALAAGLLVAQIGLGALTVRMLLPGDAINPMFIVAHLATALAFFGTLVVLAVKAQSSAGLARPGAAPTFPPYLVPFAGLVALAVYLQTLLGGMVASHNAGLVCPGFPLCAGSLVPTLAGLVGLQVMHRLGAYLVAALIVAFAIVAWRHGGAARAGALAALILVAFQIALGIMNVLLLLPLAVRAAHHANAFLLFGSLIATCAALMRHPVGEPLPSAALTAQG